MRPCQNFKTQLHEREAMPIPADHQSQPESKWSDFPADLLIKIAKLISTSKNTIVSCQHQILRFRAVCKPWRSALSYHHKYDDTPVSPFIPLPIHAPPSHLVRASSSYYYYAAAPEPKDSFYLVYSTAYVLESLKNPSKSHFIVVDHLSDQPGKVYCRKPLSVLHDRSCNGDIGSPRSMNLMDYRVLVVSEDYSLRKLVRNDDGSFQLPVNCENFCKKAVLLWNPEYRDENHGIVLVLFDDGKLGEYHLIDGKWKTLYDGKNTKCSDIIKDKAGCIVIDHKANAYLISYDIVSRSFSCNLIAGEVVGSRKRHKRLVLDPNGNLYMIAQGSLWFTTYTLSYGTWRSETMSGPYAIVLVGLDSAYFAEIKDFSCLSKWGRSKCLIFNKRSFPLYKSEHFDSADKLLDRTGPYELYFDESYRCHARPVFGPVKEYQQDYSLIFSSPSKWEELTPPPAPPCPPPCLNEQQANPHAGCGSDEILELHSSHSEDEHSASEPTKPSAGNANCDISRGKTAAERKGKRTANDANHSELSITSRSKSRKIMDSQPAGDNSETDGGLLGSIEKLLAAITRLISNPIEAQSDPPGCSIREVIQDLSTLPGVKVGSDFYFSALLLFLKKEHRELYKCLENADIKYKWLQYMIYKS